MEFAEGVSSLRKNSGETQEQFKERVLKEFGEMLYMFVFEDEDNFYQVMVNAAAKEGEEEATAVKDKINMFQAGALRKIMEMSTQVSEIPVPDNTYFKGLYNRYENSNQSVKAVKEITQDFFTALDNLIRQIDFTYDGYFPSNLNRSVNILRRSRDEGQESFSGRVRLDYTEFVYGFMSEGGTYFELFAQVGDFLMESGRSNSKTFQSAIDTLLRESVPKLNQISQYSSEAPVPNTAYFRAIYNKLAQAKSPLIIMRLADDFMSGINEFNKQVSSAYKRL